MVIENSVVLRVLRGELLTVQRYYLARGRCRGLMTLVENSGVLSRFVEFQFGFQWVMWGIFCIFVVCLIEHRDTESQSFLSFLPLVKGAGGCSFGYVIF